LKIQEKARQSWSSVCSLYALRSLLKLETFQLCLERVSPRLQRLHRHIHFNRHIDVFLRDLLNAIDRITDLLRTDALL
jgi:hypothetical protein